MSLPASFLSIVVYTAVLLLAGALVFLFFVYHKVASQLKEVQNERDTLRNNTNDAAHKIMEDARYQSMIILQKAEERAEQILADTKQFHIDAKRIFETELKDVTAAQSQELQKASLELVKNYEQKLASIESQDINLFKNMSETIEHDVTENLKEFKLALEKQTVESQRIISEKLDEQYASVRTEVDEYKKEQLQRVDEHILQLLEKITLLTLKKSLSLENHQDLVVEALQEARKEALGV